MKQYERMASDPVTSSIFAGINTTFKLAEFGLSLHDAPEEVKVFCRLIRRVRDDRAEAGREFREKADLLNLSPRKKTWIEDTMRDVDSALITIGTLVESGRADSYEGRSMTLKHRFDWVLKRKESFLTKQSLLSTCHNSLSTAIVYMQSLPGPGISRPPSPPPPSYWSRHDEEEQFLRSPSARRPKFKAGASDPGIKARDSTSKTTGR
jgi:hypothetical protein